MTSPWDPHGGPPGSPGPGYEPLLVTIGDIGVTPNWITTPQGNRPAAGLQWTVTDMSRRTQGIPTWAVVLAVLLFVVCFLGLLFLLVKEDRTDGYVQVTVQGPHFFHATQLPVSSPYQVAQYVDMVNYARSVTAAALPPR